MLLNNLAKYGTGIARENFQAETAILDNIISEWLSQNDLTEAMTALGLTAWLEEMQTANREFNKVYLARTAEYGNANPATIKSKRSKTNTVYYELHDVSMRFIFWKKQNRRFTKMLLIRLMH